MALAVARGLLLRYPRGQQERRVSSRVRHDRLKGRGAAHRVAVASYVMEKGDPMLLGNFGDLVNRCTLNNRQNEQRTALGKLSAPFDTFVGFLEQRMDRCSKTGR